MYFAREIEENFEAKKPKLDFENLPSLKNS